MGPSLFSRLTVLLAAAAFTASIVSAQAQAPAPAPAAKKTPAPASLPAGQFNTEADAKSHCPGDTVVWVNTKSKIYHYAGHADYGKTKRGAYVCEKEATGFRAAKGEKKS